MLQFILILSLAITTYAARPFLNEPDTGFQDFLGPDFPKGKLPEVKDLWSIHDFDYAARNFLNNTAYAWIRYATGGETSILGHEFDAPLFISPAATPGPVGGYVPKDRELGLIQGANTGNILFIPALYAEMGIGEIAKAKGPGQVTFQQLYAQHNMSFNQGVLDAAKQAGSKAIVWTIDAAADGAWVRGARFTLPPRTDAKDVTTFTWDFYKQLKSMTDLPIIPKGITSVEEARMAVSMGAPAFIISNHGARHLDGAPSALQVALSIHDEAPEIFQKVEVLADGGVRYGSDIVKLLALGCRAVGLGRSFLYANIYGTPGVERAIKLLKDEILLDLINLGVTDMKQLNASYVSLSTRFSV
ncbi:MAG: hypothetical protein Q9227_005753 [Pyrenula ochraceoflavens]